MTAVPDHLKYKSECWESRLTSSVCLMLACVHLNHLQNDFYIHQLLEKSHREATSAVVDVAAEILAVTLQIGMNQNQAWSLRHDFPYIVSPSPALFSLRHWLIKQALGHGLPCAAVLVTALQDTSRDGGTKTMPTGLSRSRLIRDLVVFNSQLESMWTPAEADQKIFRQASKAITRALDELLDGTSTSAAAVNAPTGAQRTMSRSDGRAHDPMAVSSPAGNDTTLPEFDILNDPLDGFDLAAWVKNIDWSGTGGEWSTF